MTRADCLPGAASDSGFPILALLVFCNQVVAITPDIPESKLRWSFDASQSGLLQCVCSSCQAHAAHRGTTQGERRARNNAAVRHHHGDPSARPLLSQRLASDVNAWGNTPVVSARFISHRVRRQVGRVRQAAHVDRIPHGGLGGVVLLPRAAPKPAHPGRLGCTSAADSLLVRFAQDAQRILSVARVSPVASAGGAVCPGPQEIGSSIPCGMAPAASSETGEEGRQMPGRDALVGRAKAWRRRQGLEVGLCCDAQSAPPRPACRCPGGWVAARAARR